MIPESDISQMLSRILSQSYQHQEIRYNYYGSRDKYDNRCEPQHRTDILSDDLYMTVAHDTLIQIMDKKATKMNGIEVMLRRFGISIDDTVYFGDDEDDIQPLTRCGIGVAMANGIKAAKDAADAIAESNDEDGVAIWLEKNLLRDHIE